MTINLKAPELRELKPRIMVCGIGGAGGNAVNNMIVSGLVGVDFIVANTDAQALTASKAERIIQMGLQVTEGLGAGSQPEVGRAAAEEAIEEIRDHLQGAHMCFVTAGMGGGTGTGAAPVIARTARDMGILTVGVVTKPFVFEGQRRMRVADNGINELQKSVDTLIVIPNQNLFRVANEKTTFADAFAMADQVLYSGVACITDLMVKEGLINLDFADVRAIMREMGKAMMGTGEATGEKRAILAAEAAIANPLLDEVSMKGARGLLISITGGNDLTLYEVDEAASRIRQEVDDDANIILGATFDQSLEGIVRVSVVATGIDKPAGQRADINDRAMRALQKPRGSCAKRPPRLAPSRDSPPRFQPAIETERPAAGSGDGIWSAVTVTQPLPRAAFAAGSSTSAAAAGCNARHSHRVRCSRNRLYFPSSLRRRITRTIVNSRARSSRRPPNSRCVRHVCRNQRTSRSMSRIRCAPGVATGLSSCRTPRSRRRTLLEKLAAFGMSRQDEAPPAPRQAPPLQAPQIGAHGRPAPQNPSQPNAVHAEYAKRQNPPAAPRSAQAALDPHGRVNPQRPSDDDQLEIPAFLRRQQSN